MLSKMTVQAFYNQLSKHVYIIHNKQGWQLQTLYANNYLKHAYSLHHSDSASSILQVIGVIQNTVAETQYRTQSNTTN